MSLLEIQATVESDWAPESELGRLSLDALACEERQRAGRPLPSDERRYTKLVQRMRELVQRESNAGGRSVQSDVYGAMAERAKREGAVHAGDRAASRALAAFFPPDDIASHAHMLSQIGAFEEERQIAEAFSRCPGGIILTQSFGQAEQGAPPPQVAQPSEIRSIYSQEIATSDWPDIPSDALLKAFVLAAQDQSPVNIGPLSNHDVTRALHTLAYGPVPGGEYTLRFQDASVSRPIALPALTELEASIKPERTLRVALLSHRHLAFDHHIDVNWFRNVEISTGDPHSAIEQRCADITESQLREYSGAPLAIELRQTGFLPAVVGFYRGLLRVLQGERGRFEVRVALSGGTLTWK